MSAASAPDFPGTDPSKFSAVLHHRKLTVKGIAVSAYRVKSVRLQRMHHQPNAHILALIVVTELGPVENPHPLILRELPLEYQEDPVRRDSARAAHLWRPR
jgi:hypothetical protein